jgi:hypothetical protein
MGKRLVGGLAAVLVLALGAFGGAARAGSFDCDEPGSLCAEPLNSIGYGAAYTGHDEPSLLFYSDVPGAGNSNIYRVTLPTDPRVRPTQDGRGGTWNFQLHPALWFGMALCDNQSAPEFTHAPCVANSDTNIKDNASPASPNYIGRHAGAAFLELQFYPPGWAPWPPGVSCDATRWCAAMAIFSLNLNMNTGVANNTGCLGSVGLEPANFAFVTRSGVPHAPPGPLDLTDASFTPNAATDLFMGSGDQLVIDIHDSPAGLVTSIIDLTTHQSGFMVASASNGFAQVNFEPNAASCSQTPYAFHPMYATSGEHTRVPWAAHSYNVAFSDEIGHFEYCSAVASEGGPCTGSNASDPGGADGDDDVCFSPSFSTLVRIGGCVATDNDFDGPAYQRVWPGTDPNRGQDAKLHPSSILFTSPLFNGTQNYSRIAFEADLPRIEAADFGGNCNRTTGAGCTNPPPGANFYPIYSTGSGDQQGEHQNGQQQDGQGGNQNGQGCVWQFGGTFIKGTTNTFGGNSTAEFGPLLQSVYPGPGFTPILRYNNYRSVLSANPCPA